MGGTAADAAVAATFAACAAETIFTGLAGGGFATYFEASTGQVTCLDFFCAEPGLDGDRKPGPMKPIAVRFGTVAVPYEIGGASVAVPGVPAGCGVIHRRWGRLPWADVVAPAQELASAGVPMPAEHAYTLPMLVEAMLLGQGTSAYAPDDALLHGGDLLFHKGLADAFATIAQHGPSVCYTGTIGASIVETVRADGGALGPLDLAAYQVLERGVTTAELAGHLVLGRADLNRVIATISDLPTNLEQLSRPELVVALARALGMRGQEDLLGDTTNVTAVDAEGNACVVTTTLGLGSGLWLPDLGVHLNSMLGEGELNTGDLEPGDRLASMMCPLVVLDPSGTLRLAAGSAGASRIRSALLATLIGVLVEGMTVPEAVNAPRLHRVDDIVHVEPEFPADEVQALMQAGFAVDRGGAPSHYFGGVSAVGVDGAAGDPRRGGTGALLPIVAP
jgi:gamma-glutamyltranspeptidase/glutathione hydrolase